MSPLQVAYWLVIGFFIIAGVVLVATIFIRIVKGTY